MTRVVGRLTFEQTRDASGEWVGWWVIAVEDPPMNSSGKPEPVPCENLYAGLDGKRVEIVVREVAEAK